VLHFIVLSTASHVLYRGVWSQRTDTSELPIKNINTYTVKRDFFSVWQDGEIYF